MQGLAGARGGWSTGACKEPGRDKAGGPVCHV